MTGQMVKLPEDEDTPEKRVEKIFRMMDRDKNSERTYSISPSVVRGVQGGLQARPIDRPGTFLVRWACVNAIGVDCRFCVLTRAGFFGQAMRPCIISRR